MLRDVFFQEGTFAGEVFFDRAKFVGLTNFFEGVTFAGRASFYQADIAGGLFFKDVAVPGRLTMNSMKQSGKLGYLTLDFAEIGSDPIHIDRIEVAGRLSVMRRTPRSELWLSARTATCSGLPMRQIRPLKLPLTRSPGANAVVAVDASRSDRERPSPLSRPVPVSLTRPPIGKVGDLRTFAEVSGAARVRCRRPCRRRGCSWGGGRGGRRFGRRGGRSRCRAWW